VLSHETLFPGVHAHTVVFNVVTRHLRPPTQSLLDRLTLAQPHLALAYARLMGIIESGWVVGEWRTMFLLIIYAGGCIEKADCP
jgi:hypothetical protein